MSLPSQSQSQSQSSLNPDRHYIFGYGSLICPFSRALTAPTLASRHAQPILVRHLSRTWSARVTSLQEHGPEQEEEENEGEDEEENEVQVQVQGKNSCEIRKHILGHTAMGVCKLQQSPDRMGTHSHSLENDRPTTTTTTTTTNTTTSSSSHWCCGVLIEVNAMELEQLDLREKGYDRVEIDLADIWSVPEDPLHDTVPSTFIESLPWESKETGRNIQENHKDSCHSQDDTDHMKDPPLQHVVLQAAMKLRQQQQQQQQQVEEGQEILFSSSSSSSSSSSLLSTTHNLHVWVYIQQVSLPPNRHYPIFQSYVDVILRGCLSISPTFTRRFLDTTQLWWWDTKKDVHVQHSHTRTRIRTRTRTTHPPLTLHHETNENETLDPMEERNETAGRNPSQSPSPSPSQTQSSWELPKDTLDPHAEEHYTWIEDRLDPYYIRADMEWSTKMASHIDQYLRDHHEFAWKQRKTLLPMDQVLLRAMEKSVDEFDG